LLVSNASGVQRLTFWAIKNPTGHPHRVVCHGLHGAGARKVFSSLAYECIDVLILYWLSPM
jgi:hypothetical protein